MAETAVVMPPNTDWWHCLHWRRVSQHGVAANTSYEYIVPMSSIAPDHGALHRRQCSDNDEPSMHLHIAVVSTVL